MHDFSDDYFSRERDEALAYAASLRKLHYDADTWQYEVTVNEVTVNEAISWRAAGFAVEHGPDFGSHDLPYGLAVFCGGQPYRDRELPLSMLVKAGYALITFDGTCGSVLEPWYVSGYNPRENERQRDQLLNPGTIPVAFMRKLSPDTIGDGPRTFYSLKLTRVTLADVRVDS
jgi:hypothetical protein